MVIREIKGKRGTKLILDGRLADGTRLREKVAVYDPHDPEGKRLAWAKARDTKRTWDQEIAAGIFVPPAAARQSAPAGQPAENVSFGAYVIRFLASPRATAEHRARLPQFVALWKDRPLKSITSADVSAWIDSRLATGVTASTIRKDASVLSVLFKAAKLVHIRDGNPVAEIDLPKNDSEPGVAYEPAEVTQILAAVSPGLRRFLTALALTGARRKEIVSLTWADYREADGVLRLRRYKTASTTEFPVEGELRELLDECRRAPVVNQTYIFADDTGLAWATDVLGKILTHRVTRVLRRLGIDRPNLAPLHSFRHFFATQAVRRGVPVERLSYLLGHASLAMTQRYYRITAEDCRDAVRGHSLGTAITRSTGSR